LRPVESWKKSMSATVVGLVTPHLLRIVDLANEAQKGVNVDWHVRDSVAKTMRELSDQYNAAVLVKSYIEGLETVAGQAPRSHGDYIGVLQAAAAAARNLWRD
jgi:hypothetical protein